MTDKNKLLDKDFRGDDGELKIKKKKIRKTIGEEGSRKQTAIGLAITIVLSLMFYLPTEFKNWWKKFNQVETITILKPIGDSKDVSKVVGFKVIIKEKKDVEEVIEKLLNGLMGDYGVWVENLETGESFSI